MSLYAPMAVPIEVRTDERDNPRRAFRLSFDGEHGGSHLEFVDPPREARLALVRYVAGRLGLPSAPARH